MIDWDKYKFKSIRFNDKDLYQRDGFPLILTVENEFLTVISATSGSHHVISSATIPATNQGVVLLLKAFNVK